MKKMITILFSLLFCYFANAQNRLFLENQYGAEIICKVHNNNKTNKDVLMNNVETPIANGVRVLLGFVPFDTKLVSAWVDDLDIKASRYLPISSYVSLRSLIYDKIAKQLHACCALKINHPVCKQGICNKDAVIVIKPSGIMSGWDVSFRWEKTTGTVAWD